ncbi:MAG: beta-galactosidase [Planctomycetota bacterium]|nr:beta-galactosidase [Planctomycetota bacterium]
MNIPLPPFARCELLTQPIAAAVLASIAVMVGLALAPVGASAADNASAPETVHLKAVVVEALRCGTNLLSNPSFEKTTPSGIPTDWQWDKRNTDAACVIDRTNAHRGGQSLLITNGSAFGANVYGMLWRTQPARLVEGKPYTMSAWVKSDAPGIVSLIGGGDWQFRVQARATGGQWHRIAKTFTPGQKDCDFTLRINTESVTPGVWIDDVKLEEGTVPTVDPIGEGLQAGLFLEADEAETVIQGDGPFVVAFTLNNSRAVAGTFSAALNVGESFRQPVNLAAGVWRVLVKGETSSSSDAPCTLLVRLEEENKEGIAARAPVRFFSANNALNRLAVLRSRLPVLQADLKAVQAQGQDTSYPRVTATVLENFVGYAEEDARRGEVRRALEQVADMESMAVRLSRELKEALAGQRQFAVVPRWTGDKRPIVKSSSFLTPVRMPGSAIVERPVYFNGYGHFGQVVNDMEKWPGYGANIIQIEVGPSAVLPRESQANDAPVRSLIQTLDRAQKSGVAVCLLISPHYFPDWALVKWPHLRKHREGFLQYCLHAPEGRDLLRRFIATLIPPIKDHPALHSICLSNEPVNEEEPCEPAQRQWQVWLEKRHENVASLNALCGSNFTSFAGVPLPNPFGLRPTPVLWMDYIRFNQEFFADWHKMLADAIHEVAPGLPVHAKAMTWTMLNEGEIKYGVDATLFGGFSNINGNDSVNFYGVSDGEVVQGWQLNAMACDLQRSVLDAPVFNTENHLIADRDTGFVPATHIRAALWQAAAHGQSATTIWVWERTFDPQSDFAGSIMHRPACAEAVGVVNHDLNRAALEITAIQQARPRTVLLQSVTASVWDAGRYGDCMGKLYTALSFTGLKIGFVTERQLEAGLIPDVPVVFVPDITHFSDVALASLRQFKGRLVFVGEGDLLTCDEFGRPRASNLVAERITFRHGATTAREMHTQLMARLPAWNIRPALELRGTDQQPVWGVEWRSAEARDSLLVNLCNYRKEPTTVTLNHSGRIASVYDLLTGGRVDTLLTLSTT